MKKSLLALAVFGAFAGAASAQTNVTIYGLVDAGIRRTDSDINGKAWELASGMQSGSRLGFKGTEDLGGGLSAIFALENGFTVDNGGLDQGGRLFGRQAWVGLNGGFGTVKLGRQYTPIFTVLDSLDPFSTGIIGGDAGALAVFETYGIRMDNTINYSMPNVGGFSGQVAYGFGEVAGRFSDARNMGASVGYANGPLNVAAAYHRQDRLATSSDPTTEGKTWLVGATYDLGVVKGHVAYADNRGEAATSTRSRDGMIGVSVPVGGVGTVLASYTRHDDREGSADASFWGVGYTHSLSKRTNLYTSYSRVNNDAGSNRGFVTAGDDVNWFNVGIRHIF
ncbi:porin [Noviherbaspirillum massiliense]|uniref:porin n=1 Tax=Noviherbaspirillum massiliense TaxID=1465823 RepID=UPI00030249EC|nr:porin [Noviherbaspirillum massiliense]